MNLAIREITNSYILSKKMEKNKGLLYTKMKVFHFKDKIDSLSKDSGKIMPPIHIRMKPTNICNHHCHYCAYKADSLQLGKDMARRDFIPEDKMLEIMDDIVDMKVRAVTFSGGGEPLCYPYLLKTVKKLVEKDIKFSAITNAANLKGEIAKIFARHGMWLRISMDGWDDQSYQRYRGVPKGEFTKIIKNIKDFKDFGGKCYLGVSLVVDEYNALHVHEFIEKIKGVGVDSVKVSPCIVSNDGAKNDSYHEPFFSEVKKQLKKAIENFADSNFEIFDAYHGLNDEFMKKYTWCPYLQILIVIGADLNIYSCQDKAYNLQEGCIGSIKEQSFKDFWFSDKNKFFKINPAKDCRHRCVADGKNRLIFEYLDVDKEHLEFV